MYIFSKNFVLPHKHKWNAEWTTTGHNIWACLKCGKQQSFHSSIDNPNTDGKTFKELQKEWEKKIYGESGPHHFDEYEAKGARYFAEWLEDRFK